MVPNDQLWADRYSRQIRFSPIGSKGQAKLRAATVLIVGCGALGASLAQHMVRAGTGAVRLADRDFVEPSNLQRQMLFDEEDALAMLPKAVAAANKLRRINSEVVIEPHVTSVNAANLPRLLEGADLVLDGTDNAETRYAMSDACFRAGIPLFYGGIAGAQGMSALLLPGTTACLRCLLGDDDGQEQGETCDTIGVISPIVDLIAAMQAAEALKWLTGSTEALRRTWLTADLWPFRLHEAGLPGPSASCPHCGTACTDEQSAPYQRSAEWSQAADQGQASISQMDQAADQGQASISQTDQTAGLRAARKQERLATAICGRDSVQVAWAEAFELDELKQELTAAGRLLSVNPYLIKIHVPSGESLVLFPDGRVLVQGTSEEARALMLCGQYLER